MNGNDGNNSAASPMENEATLEDVWNEAVREIGQIDPKTENWKNLSLPLARIKKIMKSEEFVAQELERERQRLANPGIHTERDRQKMKFMISQEAPILITKACELMVKELTIRAWQHTERSRRRTLQRADIHAAVGEDEIFDFLIDIVPRGMATTAPPHALDGTSETQHLPERDPSPQQMEQGQDHLSNPPLGVLLQQQQVQQGDGRQMQLQQQQPQYSDTQQNSTMSTWNDRSL